MSTTAKQLTDVVLARVRDSGAAGAGIRPMVRSLLDRAQVLVNDTRPGWIVGVPYWIPAGVVLFHVKDFATGAVPDGPPLCLRVVRVSYQGRDLPECHWSRLVQSDREWLLRVQERPRHFARVGNDFLIVYPAMEVARLVTIYYAPQPPAFLDEDILTTLRDDRMPAVRLVTEVLMLLRQQDIKALPAAMTALATQLMRLPFARSPQVEAQNVASGAGGAGSGGAGGGGVG